MFDYLNRQLHLPSVLNHLTFLKKPQREVSKADFLHLGSYVYIHVCWQDKGGGHDPRKRTSNVVADQG